MKLQDYAQNKPVLETDQLILRPLRKRRCFRFEKNGWVTVPFISIGENAPGKVT